MEASHWPALGCCFRRTRVVAFDDRTWYEPLGDAILCVDIWLTDLKTGGRYHA